MTGSEKIKFINEATRLNRKFELKWFHPVKKTLDKKVSSLIDKIKTDGIEAGIRYLNLDLPNTELTATINKLYEDVGGRYALMNERRLRKEVRESRSKSLPANFEVKRFGLKDWVSWIANYLNFYLIEKITFNVNATLRDSLLKVMNESIEKGWGVDETVKHLEDLPFTKYQAARIVRTEVNRASNTGTMAQANTFEYELNKIWISVHDNRTRGVNPKDHADHIHLDGQTVDIDKPFTDPKNGHELLHPGDPKGKAEDTINCRCQIGTVAKRDANGRMIPKKNTLLPSQFAPAA